MSANNDLRARVVLLGASNLTRGLAVFIDAARKVLGGPLDILAAVGHGRSFGQPSSVLGRRLCGIAQCALWEELAKRTPLPLYAFVTDIGNDILYGVSSQHMLSWVASCMDRLHQFQAHTILTELPLATVRKLGPTKYAVFRSIMFPRSKMTLEMARSAAEKVNNEVYRLAAEHRVTLVSQEAKWFGWDPIHIRRRLLPPVAMHLLSHWRSQRFEGRPPSHSLFRSIYYATRVPLERRVFGIHQRRAQPCIRLSDGTLVSLY